MCSLSYPARQVLVELLVRLVRIVMDLSRPFSLLQTTLQNHYCQLR